MHHHFPLMNLFFFYFSSPGERNPGSFMWPPAQAISLTTTNTTCCLLHNLFAVSRGAVEFQPQGHGYLCFQCTPMSPCSCSCPFSPPFGLSEFLPVPVFTCVSLCCDYLYPHFGELSQAGRDPAELSGVGVSSP